MATAIGIRFPAGRYHAAAWDRHVNEAQVEWPPSPLRFHRALIATWHRKGDLVRFPQEALEHLIEVLAADRPLYSLPSATLAHTRHYMPVGSGPREAKRLIHDAFLRLDQAEDLIVVWPRVELAERERALLAHLVERLGYLGRAESWCECRLLESWSALPDAGPQESADDWMTHRGSAELVDLPSPMAPDAYREWRDEQIERYGLERPRLVREKRLRATLPERLLDALRLDTGPVRKEGWSRFPGTERVTYLRPEGCFKAPAVHGSPRGTSRGATTTVRLVLVRLPPRKDETPPPLPLMEDALRVGEAVRQAALRFADGDSPALSGHDMPEGAVHQHAFYLPEDRDGDGRIDHVIVHAPAKLAPEEVAALSSIERLWISEQGEWSLLLESSGARDDFEGHPYLRPSRTWTSVTPYLHPWYRKTSFTVEDQIRKELALRGLPEPDLERLETLPVGPRERRPVHFHRFRRRRGLTQPDTGGSFWQLTFPRPVPGPIALGYSCHYGLGIFAGGGTC